MSQDLILATQEVGAAVDTATLNPQATARRAALAERSFYTLYLTRTIAFSRFLDCLPRDIDVKCARTEWDVFQHDPPRTSGGDDVFAVIYRQVTKAGGSVFDLRRTAKARFSALVQRNLHLFPEKRSRTAPLEPSFYLAVDEVEAPVFQSPTSGNRPACSRCGVSALFYGFDQPQ